MNSKSSIQLPPQVLNLRFLSEGYTKLYVRIDRGTRFGNPFIIGPDGDRDQVCDLYRWYALERLKKQPRWLDELRGQNLACWCAPKRCHGDILLDLANK